MLIHFFYFPQEKRLCSNFKNKNREDKIEILKRTHIQKCINWCEKNQLPYNKFTDKLNIFLYKKEDKIEETY
jgi:hypothetical protein